MYLPIYLGKDPAARRQTMQALKPIKLRNTFEYLMERSRFLDELVPYATQEISQDADGNILFAQFQVVQFTGVRSLREVFDACLYFFANEEITLSERIGHLTIRDDHNTIDDGTLNARFHSIDESSVITEWNSAGFCAISSGDDALSNKEYAILSTDCVDKDELYPYDPATRLRKDRSGGIVFTTTKRKRLKRSADGTGLASNQQWSNKDQEELVVVMRRGGVSRLHRPAFALSPDTKESIMKTITGWSDALIDTIRDQLRAHAA